MQSSKPTLPQTLHSHLPSLHLITSTVIFFTFNNLSALFLNNLDIFLKGNKYPLFIIIYKNKTQSKPFSAKQSFL